jgi:sirohydrochlorin cobaltochelatase
MSTTRSPSPPAPVIDRDRRPALLLAAHGSARCGDAAEAACTQAARLARSRRFAEVAVGFLRGSPELEAAAAAIAAAPLVHVVPFLMTEGRLARVEIPRRLAALPARARMMLHAPIGLAPGLPTVVAGCLGDTATDIGIEPARATVLLVGHGGPDTRAAARPLRRVAAHLRSTTPFAAVELAFLEQPPLLPDAVRRLCGPALVVGFFAGDGTHSASDVPRVLAAAPAGAGIFYTGPIGSHPRIADLILSEIRRVNGREDGCPAHGGARTGVDLDQRISECTMLNFAVRAPCKES